MRINSIAHAMISKHILRLLKLPDNTRIISISSRLGFMTLKTDPGHYSYASFKAALNMMNKALALEINENGIMAAIVNPGWIRMDMGEAIAKLSPEGSARGMIDNVLIYLPINETGKFLNGSAANTHGRTRCKLRKKNY